MLIFMFSIQHVIANHCFGLVIVLLLLNSKGLLQSFALKPIAIPSVARNLVQHIPFSTFSSVLHFFICCPLSHKNICSDTIELKFNSTSSKKLKKEKMNSVIFSCWAYVGEMFVQKRKNIALSFSSLGSVV